MKGELPDVQAGFQRGRGTRNQIVNISWIREKAREFQKNIYVCFIDYTEAFYFSVWVTINWKIFKEMGIPDHLSFLLRNMYAGQQATGRMRHRITHSQLGKEYDKAVYSTLLNLYMHSTSCEMPGWMNHKLESRLLGEISTNQICR